MPAVQEIATILGINLGICIASFVILWAIGCAVKDVTFVDAWWALGLAFMAVTTFFQAARRRCADAAAARARRASGVCVWASTSCGAGARMGRIAAM
jgi:steroid 5-alpha reductase family enzyme